MAAIEYVTLSITRTSLPHGSVCRVDYRYLLAVDAAEYDAATRFTVKCELCGTHPFFDQELGAQLYDEHRVTATTPMPQMRSFLVPCTLLNERWGKDSIYLRVIAMNDEGNGISAESSMGQEFSARSPQVRDSF